MQFLSLGLARKALLPALVLGLAAFAAPAAHAQNVVDYTVTLTNASPQFNRPIADGTALSSVGTSVFYQADTFSTNLTGTYTFETVSAALASVASEDTFLILYQNSFDPLAPLTNFVVGNDDGGPGALSLASTTLTSGTQYILVTTTYESNTTGTINTRISGPEGATITRNNITAAPEPGTAALVTIGLMGTSGMVIRRRHKAL